MNKAALIIPGQDFWQTQDLISVDMYAETALLDHRVGTCLALLHAKKIVL